MPIPTLGRTVIVRGIGANGASESPAIITRAWSSRDTADGAVAVNLTVLPDMSPPVARSSVMLFDTEALASIYCGANPQALAAYWPPRA